MQADVYVPRCIGNKQTIVLILVIASLVQMMEMMFKKLSPYMTEEEKAWLTEATRAI